MRSVPRPSAPEVLCGDAARRERDKTCTFFADPANAERPFREWKIYGHKGVRAALNDAFHRKCAYCESRYAGTAPVDVEHFRPKSGYACNGALRRPGYYWLAAEWTNLLPSCIDCNRSRIHEFAGRSRASGKASQFPIADESHRAHAPGEEDAEELLLLNPCLDHPEEHLQFSDDGFVDAADDDPKGRASIEIFGLNRPGLVLERRYAMLMIQALLKGLRETAADLEADPSNPTLEQRLIDKRRELEQFTAPDWEYSVMIRQMVEPVLALASG